MSVTVLPGDALAVLRGLSQRTAQRGLLQETM
jgi:hypothetical protein